MNKPTWNSNTTPYTRDSTVKIPRKILDREARDLTNQKSIK